MTEKICKYCWGWFMPKTKKQIFCNSNHKRYYYIKYIPKYREMFKQAHDRCNKLYGKKYRINMYMNKFSRPENR